MSIRETPLIFDCNGESLLGLIARPESPKRLGVLILVGGPQYRVGAHRQFVHLARALAGAGYASMRFDYRGMGDSSGDARWFWETADDIKAGLDAFMSAEPDIDGVVLWGLCGGASAACMHPVDDERVKGLILVNPWLTSDQLTAQVYMKHYYLSRLVDPSFWKKLVSGRFRLVESVRGFFALAKQSRADVTTENPADDEPPDSLGATMVEAMRAHARTTAIFLSGRDYVAKAFEQSLAKEVRFKAMLADGRVFLQEFERDDHTFSSSAARVRIERATLDWLAALSRESRAAQPHRISCG